MAKKTKRTAPGWSEDWITSKLFDNPSIFWAAGNEQYERERESDPWDWKPDYSREELLRFLPLLGHLIAEENWDECCFDPYGRHEAIFSSFDNVMNNLSVIHRVVDFEIALANSVNAVSKARLQRKPLPRLLSDKIAKEVRSLAFDGLHFRDWEMEDSHNLYVDLAEIDLAIQQDRDLPVEPWRRVRVQVRNRGSGKPEKLGTRYFILSSAAMYEKFNQFEKRAVVNVVDNPEYCGGESDGIPAQLHYSDFLDFLLDAAEVFAEILPSLNNDKLGSNARSVLRRWRRLHQNLDFQALVNFSPYQFSELVSELRKL